MEFIVANVENMKFDIEIALEEQYGALPLPFAGMDSPFQEVLRELHQKKSEIWEDFYTTEAMINREWMQANQDLRHLTTRFAVHGFHHLACNNKNHHMNDVFVLEHSKLKFAPARIP